MRSLNFVVCVVAIGNTTWAQSKAVRTQPDPYLEAISDQLTPEVPRLTETVTPIYSGRGILDIDAFLQQCPQDDPAYSEITADFTIRRNGAIVSAIPCKAPIFTATASSEITHELIAAQALRVIYYLDRGHPGLLPWTSLTFYEWLKGQIGGIDIDDLASDSFCCTLIAGRRYIHTPVFNIGPPFPVSFMMGIEFISGRIALYGHEARHVDGFPHSSCCPAATATVPGAIISCCDESYSVTNLSPYEIQYWTYSAFANGTLDVGIACLSASRQDELVGDMVRAANLYQPHFCALPPPVLIPALLPATQCGRRRAVRH